MLLWPAVALTGFLVLVAVVVALGRMSTNRYEEQRKREGSTRPSRSPSQVSGPPGTRSAGDVDVPGVHGGES